MTKRIKKGLTLLQTLPNGRQRKVRVNKVQGVRALCYVHDIVGWKRSKRCKSTHPKDCRSPKCSMPTFATRLQEVAIPVATLEKMLETSND